MRRHAQLIATLSVLAIVALTPYCVGCGAGALRVHASTANVAITAERAARQGIIDGTQHAVDACADMPCVEGVQANARVAAAAHDATLPLLHAYRDAILAYAANETDAALAVVVAAALALVREWGSFVGAMDALGVEVPSLPFGGAQ